MYNSVYTINADISSVDSPHKLTFYKREHRYQTVMIVCSSELGSVNFSDSYAVVAGIKPDNTNIYDPCIIFGNCIQFSLTEQMTAVAGTYLLDVLIKKDGDDTYRDVACQLEFVIQNGSFDDDITSSSEYQAVTDIESAAMANVKQWVIDNAGAANTIESISLNGALIVPDSNKNVNIEVTDSNAYYVFITATAWGSDTVLGGTILTYNSSVVDSIKHDGVDITAKDIVDAYESGKSIQAQLTCTFIDHNASFKLYVQSATSQVNGNDIQYDVTLLYLDPTATSQTNYPVRLQEIGSIHQNIVSSLYIDLESAATTYNTQLFGTPTAPTPEITDNSTRIATTAYINALIDSIMSSPPME